MTYSAWMEAILELLRSPISAPASKGHEEAAHEKDTRKLLMKICYCFKIFVREQTLGDGSAQTFLSAMPSLKRKRKN